MSGAHHVHPSDLPAGLTDKCVPLERNPYENKNKLKTGLIFSFVAYALEYIGRLISLTVQAATSFLDVSPKSETRPRS